MISETAQAWNVSTQGLPYRGTTQELLERLVTYAVLAPSTHNSQPWQFRVRSDVLELLADRSRALPIADPQGRELTISCGAAMQFAHLAARNFNFEGAVELLPDPTQLDLLARLRLGMANSPSARETRRFHAICERHTSRTEMRVDPVSEHRMDSLGSLATRHGAVFEISRKPAIRRAVADLVAEAERTLIDKPEFRKELAAWIKPSTSPDQDGMSVSSFGMFDRLSNVAAATISSIDLGASTARTHRELVLGAPVIGVLATRADNRTSWLKAGMALADISLELAACGLSSSYFSQPLMLPAMRSRLAEIIGLDACPQMLVRYGRSEPAPPAARRRAGAVTRIG